MRVKGAKDSYERSKIVYDFLVEKFSDITLKKDYFDENYNFKTLIINQTKDDMNHLTHWGFKDTMSALTQLEELIEASEYVGEEKNVKKKSHKNDYFWHFKVNFMMDGSIYSYYLDFGKNKYDGNVALYAITNCKEKNSF